MSSSQDLPMTDSFSQQSAAFISWLTAQPNVTVNPNIKIEDFRSLGSGRGVSAINDIAEGDDLFIIPRNAILSVKNSSLNDQLAEQLEELGPWLSLMVVMIYEYLRGEQSKWDSYFKILPSTFNTLMFWNEKQLSELQASAIVDKIGKQSADQSILESVAPLIRSNSSLFPPIVGLASWADEAGTSALLQLAHRMGSLIMAYAFDIDKTEEEESPDEDGFVPDEEEQAAKGMVPLADLLNADADRNNALLFQEECFFIMRATRRIAGNEQIFNDYGEIPRADLLRRYGYVTENYAPYDVVELPLELICQAAGLTDSDTEQRTKLKFLKGLGVLDDGYCIQRPSVEDTLIDLLPDELLVLIKTLTLTHEQLSRQVSRNKPLKSALPPAEATLLLKSIRALLGRYSTTVEQDYEILRHLVVSDVSTHRLKMAINVRIGEKEVLCHLSSMLSKYVEQTSLQIPAKRIAESSAATEFEEQRKRNKQLK